jgi:hypothetical protein
LIGFIKVPRLVKSEAPRKCRSEANWVFSPVGVNFQIALFSVSPTKRFPAPSKAIPKTPWTSEAKMLEVPDGLNSRIVATSLSETKRFPLRLKAKPTGCAKPVANVVFVPLAENFRMSDPSPT